MLLDALVFIFLIIFCKTVTLISTNGDIGVIDARELCGNKNLKKAKRPSFPGLLKTVKYKL